MGKTAQVDRFDLGFLGGGQLARMSIQAAQRMGLRCLSLDPGDVTPASQIAPSLQGELADPKMIRQVLDSCDFVTLENEFIPGNAIREAFYGGGEEKLIPGIDALLTIQDKLLQRQALRKAGVPSPEAYPIVDGPPNELSFPMVLKARFGGYDGKGTRYAKTAEEFESYRSLWAAGGWLAEAFVPFKRELAAMVYVSPRQKGCFPTVETVQTNHVCDLVFPANLDASTVALAAVEAIGGVGLFGVEMFELKSGDILINELAPRPHNTGHYTLDWGGVSQFEQHVRVVMGLPCIEPAGLETCMANLLGQPGAGDYRQGLRESLEADAAVRVHWYGKAEAKPGRKMGHINVSGEHCVHRATEARNRFYAAWTR